jgi:uncharacterized protein YacL
MFSGMQELLLIVLIVLGIFLVPRMIKPMPAPRKAMLRRPVVRLTRAVRLAIISSVLWPAACALYLKPWQQSGILFVTLGIGPVALGWSLRWVLAGLKNKR